MAALNWRYIGLTVLVYLSITVSTVLPLSSISLAITRIRRSSSSASTNILMSIWSLSGLQVNTRMPSMIMTSAGSTVTVSVFDLEQVIYE